MGYKLHLDVACCGVPITAALTSTSVYDNDAAALSSIEHWLVIALCTPVLIALSFWAFLHIESPAMRLTPKVVRWVNTR